MSDNPGTRTPVVLDGGERRCVQLLLELRALIATLAAGTLIHVITTDPAAPLDLPAWCHLTGHTWLGTVDAQDRPRYALRVSPTDPTRPWHRTT